MAGGSHLLMAPPGLKPLPCSRAVPPLLTITCTIGAVCGSNELQRDFPQFSTQKKILSFLFLFFFFVLNHHFEGNRMILNSLLFPYPLCTQRARLLLKWQQVILWIHSQRYRHAHLGRGSAERQRQAETGWLHSTLTGLWSASSQSFMVCTVLQCCVHRRARDTGLGQTQSPAWL